MYCIVEENAKSPGLAEDEQYWPMGDICTDSHWAKKLCTIDGLPERQNNVLTDLQP